MFLYHLSSKLFCFIRGSAITDGNKRNIVILDQAEEILFGLCMLAVTAGDIESTDGFDLAFRADDSCFATGAVTRVKSKHCMTA